MPSYRLGVDIGGTFTDLVLIADDGRVATYKLSSTPDDYGRAILDGVDALLAQAELRPEDAAELVHGTTVATNAILEGRGAATGLIATGGFRDNLEIGRLRYPRLYDLAWRKPVPLVPRRWRMEVRGRLGPRGEEVEPLDEEDVRRAVAFLRAEGVRSLAVSLMHAYANPAHERRTGEIVRACAPDLPVSLSSDVLPEIGEYERTSTTAINAYLQPVVGRYLSGLAAGLAGRGVYAPVLVMQSSGGVMSAQAAAEHPIHVVESGPAAGVIAAQQLAVQLGLPDVLTLDMGGTTAKASVVEDGRLLRAAEYEVGAGLSVGNRLNRGAGYILRVPAIDVAEVGAGGGSLVWLDPAGALHVGPRSAGAVPGPVCYGLGGDEPTLTDANLLLGYLNPDALLDGALPVDRARAEAVFRARVADPLGLDLHEAAHGVHRIGVASMVRVVRAVSSERGRDPRRFGLVAFGGNGPLHAAAVAAELGIDRIVVPPWPGLFSAFGLLQAEPARHFSRTVLRQLGALSGAEVEEVFGGLEARAIDALARDGHAAEHVRLERTADLRYHGQSFELRVPVDRQSSAAQPSVEEGPSAAEHACRQPSSSGTGGLANGELRARFEAEHERTYGHRAPDDPVELVHVRITATYPRGPGAQGVAGGAAASDRASFATETPETPSPRSLPPSSRSSRSRRAAYFGREIGLIDTPVLVRGGVSAAALPGPAIVEEYDATTLVPPGWTVRRDERANLVLEALR